MPIKPITTVEELEALYGEPHPLALKKVAHRITPAYRRFIEASRFLILSTVGPEGTDASPRGDDGPVAHIANPETILIPDWKGNNRTDSLRNIVRDGRVSLMFMINGSDIVVRANGKAIVTADSDLTGLFEQKGKHPRAVIVFTIEDLYYQCAKALIRSGLWQRMDDAVGVPTAGQFLEEQSADFDGTKWDREYPAYAKPNLW